MTIQDHCKAIEEYVKAHDISTINYSPYFNGWNVVVYVGKGHKDAIGFTAQERTLEAAVDNVLKQITHKE